MTTLRPTDELVRLAGRVVWFKPATDVLRRPDQLVAYALAFGTHADVKVLRSYLSDDALRAALDRAPPGIIDPRSWAYWNLRLGRYPAPPLPERRL